MKKNEHVTPGRQTDHLSVNVGADGSKSTTQILCGLIDLQPLQKNMQFHHSSSINKSNIEIEFQYSIFSDIQRAL